MKRKLTPSECLFLSNSSQSFQILLQIELSHRIDPKNLQKALSELSNRLPALFCSANDGYFQAKADQPVGIEVASEERCTVNSPVVLDWLHQWVIHPWDLAREAPLRCLLVNDAGHSLLAMMLHHGVCDGKTGVLLLNHLLDALRGQEGLRESLTAKRVLPVSLEDLFDIPVPETFQAEVGLGAPRSRVPHLGLEHLVWSEDDTEAFRKACRVRALSCHSVFCTAASRVLRQLVQQKKPETATFSVHFPINVRDKLGLPNDVVGNLICFARIDEGGTHPHCFFEHARYIQAQIREQIAPHSLSQAAEELSRVAQSHGHLNPHSASAVVGQGKPPEVHIMNLGSLDGLHHQEITRLSIANYFAPRFFSEDHLAIMIFSWRNALHFVTHYSKDHGDHFACLYAKHFQKALEDFALNRL
jgi:hypothetical protein